MTGGIYLLQEDDQLVEMTEQQYDSEALLQELLAKYSNLLAGDQMDSASPRRWLLVKREAPLPSADGGPDRWSVDHLFLDQDAIPALIEVKRSSDTRIRREVIGQMLDYAANAVVYWPIESIRAQFDTECRSSGAVADQVLADFLGAESDPEVFWQQSKTNLQAGKIRMVFVADVIPPELRRVVEFLNEQMSPAEVLAVEIKQYVGKGLRTLVPRVIGQTAEAQQKKADTTTRTWDEASFFQDLESRRGPDEAKVVRTILDWAKDKLPRLVWGKGKTVGSVYPTLDYNGTDYWPIGLWSSGGIEIEFQWLRSRAPFGDDHRRLELLNRLNSVSGVSIPADALNRRPSISLSALKDKNALTQFLGVLDWFVNEAKTQ